MKQTTNYNLNLPEANDMFSLEHWNQNSEMIDAALTPEFEDYTGDTSVPDAASALAEIKSNTKLGTLFQNIKAFCKGCCTLGMLVNNCVTDNADLPLAASQGKFLLDSVNALNGDLQKRLPYQNYRTDEYPVAAALRSEGGAISFRATQEDGSLQALIFYPDGRINLEKKDASGNWFSEPLAYAGFTKESYVLQPQSIIITDYFAIKPSEGVWLQLSGKNASINFTGTFNTNIPDNANTVIATLPEPYRPKSVSYGAVKVWPSKDSSGNITAPADTAVLGLYADGVLRIVNHFGQAYGAGRYVAGFLNYITT